MNAIKHNFTKRLLVTLMLILLSSSAALFVRDVFAAKTASAVVVYHIDDNARAIPMLRNITNHRKADVKIRIIVVALGAGVDFLVDGAMDERGNSFDALVDPLMIEGVEFRVCNNTLKSRKIAPEALLPDVKIVASGVAELARLQIEEHAAYIKP
jgi:uncharacterized protein